MSRLNTWNQNFQAQLDCVLQNFCCSCHHLRDHLPAGGLLHQAPWLSYESHHRSADGHVRRDARYQMMAASGPELILCCCKISVPCSEASTSYPTWDSGSSAPGSGRGAPRGS